MILNLALNMGGFMAPSTQTALPRDLPSLTSLRAAAALMVFAFHLQRWNVVDIPLVAVGDTGVAFFFVLSGYLLTWGYAGGVDARRFYVRRFARIVPSHVVLWTLALLVPVTAFPVSLPVALTNLPLLQAWIPVERFAYGMNGVTWSLSCEIAFYAAFPVALSLLSKVSIKSAWIIVATCFTVTGVFAVAVSAPQTPVSLALIGYTNPVIRFPEFLLGVAAARATRAGSGLSWLQSALICFTCLAGFTVEHDRPGRDVWLAPLFLLVILFMADRDCRHRDTWTAAPPLVYAGKVSFAFYMVHELIIMTLRHLLGPGVSTAIVALGAACLCAVALHQVVELPCQSRLVRLLDSTRRTPPSDPVAT